MKPIKILVYGLINYAIRFFFGGLLLMGLKMNPEGFWFGFLITLMALIAAYVLLKYAIKPATVAQAIGIALTWVVTAFVLDMITAQPIVKVEAAYLLTEVQFWARLLVIPLVAPLAVRK